MKRQINLYLSMQAVQKLQRLAAEKQLQSGERVSVSAIVEHLVETLTQKERNSEQQ